VTEDKAIGVARAFLQEYDTFAQDGYPAQVPDSFSSILTADAEEIIEQDALWYGELGYRQIGPTRIVSADAVVRDGQHASVLVQLDSSRLSIQGPGGLIERSSETSQELRIDMASVGTELLVSGLTVVDDG
jgi:hypothetical protein